MKLKFGDGKNILLSDNHLLATDRRKFNYSKFPSDIPKHDTDFV